MFLVLGIIAMSLPHEIIPLITASSALGKRTDREKIYNKGMVVDSELKREGQDNSNNYLPLITAILAGNAAIGDYFYANNNERHNEFSDKAELDPKNGQDLLDAMNQRDELIFEEWNTMIDLMHAGNEQGAVDAFHKMICINN